MKQACLNCVVCIAVSSCVPAPTKPARGVLVVEAEPNAYLSVDDQVLGTVDALRGGVALTLGTHRVLIEKDGYVSAYRIVHITKSQPTLLRIDLSARLP